MFALVVLAAPLPALGQHYEPPPYFYDDDAVTRTLQEVLSKGVELTVGGGVMNFMGKTARAVTDTAGSWNVRCAVRTQSIAGVELAYVGSTGGLSAPGVNSDARLLGTGGEVAFRLNAPLRTRFGRIEPFASGGVGWARYTITNDRKSTFGRSDDVGTFPMGAGLAFAYKKFVSEVRYTYRRTFGDSLFGGSNSMRSWTATANVGLTL